MFVHQNEIFAGLSLHEGMSYLSANIAKAMAIIP